jgi:uncharacterized protein (DUF1697 family)
MTDSGPQHKYVALLRGINVGGRAIIKMDDLRAQFEALGLTDVVTYIQTGNVIFSSQDASAERLAHKIEEQLASTLGHRGRVFVLTPVELREAAARNPFDPERLDKEQHCHLMFLSREPDAARCEALMALQGEEYRFAVRGKVLYYAYPRAVAGSRRAINLERVLGAEGTARTWKVVNKLIELAG